MDDTRYPPRARYEGSSSHRARELECSGHVYTADVQLVVDVTAWSNKATIAESAGSHESSYFG